MRQRCLLKETPMFAYTLSYNTKLYYCRYDQDETGYTYGGSFPFMKAVDGLGEVILAYEMNGEDLPRDHGYPVRLIIPGHVGARQVKWLHKIRLSNTPSTKSYQCKSYLGFAPDITFEKDLAHWPPARLDQVNYSSIARACSCVLIFMHGKILNRYDRILSLQHDT